MKEAIKDFLIILFLITSVFFGIKNYILKHSTSNKMAHVTPLDSVTAIPYDEYKDTQGVTHILLDANANSVLQKEIEKQATKKAQELKPIIEDIAQTLNVKTNQVVSSTTISTSTLQDSVRFLRKELDNAKKLTYFYKDKYLSLTVRTNPLDTTDRGVFDFAYNADLNIVQYWKRNRVLGVGIGSKKSYTDISSNDPRTTIMNLKKFTVVQKEPEFGVRVQALGGYNLVTHGLSFGPSIRMDVFKGSIRGSYLYNFTMKQWTPTVTLEKDLIRL